MHKSPYFITEFIPYECYVRKYTGTENATSPKNAIKKYLVNYCGDTESFQYVKRTNRRQGCNFIVENLNTHRKSYYIYM